MQVADVFLQLAATRGKFSTFYSGVGSAVMNAPKIGFGSDNEVQLQDTEDEGICQLSASTQNPASTKSKASGAGRQTTTH